MASITSWLTISQALLFEEGAEYPSGPGALLLLRGNLVLLIFSASTERDKRHLSSWEKVK